MDDDYAQRFSDALVSEIKAEMGRRDLSSRKLGLLIGESSQYMSMRLDGGNPRTGVRVLLNIRDVAAIASALGTDATTLLERAEAAAYRPSNAHLWPDRVAEVIAAVERRRAEALAAARGLAA